MALPPVVGAALSRARSVRALMSLVGGGSSTRNGGRTCCLTSCVGCGACVVTLAVVVLSVGSALIALSAQLAGVGFDAPCPPGTVVPCTTSAGIVGAPMNCRSPYVSQGFGDTPWEHPHTGIDIVCPPATLVVAVANGVFHRDQGAPIACSYPPGRIGGLGTYGVLDAGGRTYLYGHLGAYAAPDGASVVVGQPLGFEGMTGCATGDHLHFEVLVSGRPVNPCLLLPAGYPDPHDSSGLRCWGTAPP